MKPSRLLQRVRCGRFPPHAVVFWEGDTESSLYYLQYGSLKALRTGLDGREQVLRFLDAGEIFNEIGVLAKRPNPVTAGGFGRVGHLAHSTPRLGRGGDEISADGVADYWQHGR
ncbi:MAG: cyclic nucleotide-binding domain-containing protein [Anaerolineales bacterium]|nr:cyclic nucleotide-binding domain-containing protein [Anaerolineales bacterium]